MKLIEKVQHLLSTISLTYGSGGTAETFEEVGRLIESSDAADGVHK